MRIRLDPVPWIGDNPGCVCHLCENSRSLKVGLYTGNDEQVLEAYDNLFENAANLELELFAARQRIEELEAKREATRTRKLHGPLD